MGPAFARFAHRGKQVFHHDINGRLTEAVGQDRDAGRPPPRQHPLSWLRTRRFRTSTARAGEWKFGRALLRKVDALAAQAAKSPHRHLLALLVPTVPLCAFLGEKHPPGPPAHRLPNLARDIPYLPAGGNATRHRVWQPRCGLVGPVSGSRTGRRDGNDCKGRP